MDSKINLPQLAKALTLRKKMSQKEVSKIEDVNKRVERVSDDKVSNRVAKALLAEGYDYNNLMG